MSRLIETSAQLPYFKGLIIRNEKLEEKNKRKVKKNYLRGHINVRAIINFRGNREIKDQNISPQQHDLCIVLAYTKEFSVS